MSSLAPPKLAIVIPCYNESAILPHTLKILHDLLLSLIAQNIIHAGSFLYLINDGSQDTTWEIIMEWHQLYPQQIKGLKLAKNAGHQNALLAGLLNVKNKVHCAISIDADLQDDINVIPNMLSQFQQGNDIVYGVRQSRKKDSFFKRITAQTYYKMMRYSGSDIVLNHADFRLLSNRAISTLSKFKERNLFLRGIFPLMGYKVAYVYYDRKERTAGETKYTFKKMLSLAWNGLTSFSHAPLNLIFIMGVTSFLFSLLLIIWVFIAKLYTSTTIPGWASIMIPICFMGGVQLLSVGVIGEYVAKIYLEVKRRPRFIKDKELV